LIGASRMQQARRGKAPDDVEPIGPVPQRRQHDQEHHRDDQQ